MLKLSALLGIGGLALLLAASPWTGGAPASEAAARGRALFSGKGCAQCHSHAAVPESGHFATDGQMAPDLTDRPLDAGYLRRWLRDPAAVRPDATMPNLGLSDDEIEALIVFLREPPQRGD